MAFIPANNSGRRIRLNQNMQSYDSYKVLLGTFTEGHEMTLTDHGAKDDDKNSYGLKNSTRLFAILPKTQTALTITSHSSSSSTISNFNSSIEE